MRRYWVIIICLCALCACVRKATVCGVSYEGCTPWELAARLDADAHRAFRPAAVDYIGSSKTLIIGWSLPYESRDTIICDLSKGQVTHAVLVSQLDNKE